MRSSPEVGMSDTSRYRAAAGELDGEGTVILTDRVLDLVATIVPGVGSNLISLACPSKGLEFIHGPESLAQLRDRPTRYGNPVLLPPNRIRGGSFSFAGRAYTLPLNRPPHHIHGLVHSLRWQVVGQGAAANGAWVQTAMEARRQPDFQATFPQDFCLQLTFAMHDGVLSLKAEARNSGPGAFPFGLGYHTYFQLPMAAGEGRDGYRLTLPAQERWELVDSFPTGRILPLATHEHLQAARLDSLRLDDVYTSLAPGEPEIVARIWHEDSGRGLEFASDRGFPHWVVWSGPTAGSPFICLEPYSCVTNAPNLPLPPEVTGLTALDESGSWRGSVEFRPAGYW